MVRSLAERFGIASQLDKYPNELSGGQRQRASAARAIVKQPSILFADEPTGALDSNSATELLKTLKEANEELHTTILMVTHDAYAASFANRILIFKDGSIIRELLKQDADRRTFYERIILFDYYYIPFQMSLKFPFLLSYKVSFQNTQSTHQCY